MKRRALITGATGFVGRHVAQRLLGDGWEVDAVVRASSSLERLGESRGKVRSHVHDGTTEGLLQIVAAARPDAVFHLAAAGGAQHAPQDLVPLLQANLIFGAQLLEAMAAHGVSRLVATGTHWQQYRDEDYNPVGLYAACKEAFDKLVRYYVESRGLRAITLMLADTYGGGDTRPKLLNLLHEALPGKEPLRLTAGEQFIDLVHVEDVAAAFAVAAERLWGTEKDGQARYAVRSGAAIRLRALVELYGEVAGAAVPVAWGAIPYRPREPMTPWTRGSVLPGWAPRIGLRQGLQALLDAQGGQRS